MPNKAVGVIFGNIHDQDVPELTANRTLASVPFGGRYRLIDFVLSNMVNSEITKVGIITKSNYQSLMDHVGSGKSWDLSRKNGGLIVLPPYADETRSVYNTRFEAIKGIITFIRRCSEEYVVMSDCDNVCNFDFDAAIRYHIEKNADITAVYRKSFFDPTSRRPHTVLDVDGSGRVLKVENVDKASGEKCFFTNKLVINRRFLLNILENSDKLCYTSFSRDVMKRADQYRIFGYELTGYFANIDSMASYYRHSLGLLDKSNRDLLFKAAGAMIYTKVRDSAPLRVENGGKAVNSLIADGCVVEGEVRGSVLFRGVRVAKGAVVTNSIVMQDVSVSAGSSLNACIVDKNAIILDKRNLSGHPTHPYFIAKNAVI